VNSRYANVKAALCNNRQNGQVREFALTESSRRKAICGSRGADSFRKKTSNGNLMQSSEKLVFTNTPDEEPGKWWHSLVVVAKIHILMEPFPHRIGGKVQLN
jgi:hypothetical protein